MQRFSNIYTYKQNRKVLALSEQCRILAVPEQEKTLVGRVAYANGDTQEFTDAEAFLKCIREELPYHPTTGFRYEVLADDPNLRKQVDDILFDFYGEENPKQLADYQKKSRQGMTFGEM